MKPGAARLAFVGAGTIVQHQLRALERLPGADVVGVVDPQDPAITYRGRPVPVADSIASLLDLGPTVVLVAVPSHDHITVVDQLLDAAWRGPTLVEKPLGTTRSDVQAFWSRLDGASSAVTCVYHARFAPEVRWGTKVGPDKSRIRSVEMAFADPYGAEGDRARRQALGRPWVDSGINALSILDRWLPVEGLRPESVDVLDDGLSLRIWACHDGVDEGVELWVSWKVTSPSKVSRIGFASGETLVLDHQATAGRLRRGGQLLARFACDGDLPRLTRHYLELFGWLASRGWHGEPELDRRLHEALFLVEGSADG